MKKMMQNFLLLSLSIFTLLITYKLSYLIAENFFFDKLFYQKSELHGYYTCTETTCDFDGAGQRLADTSDLLTLNPGKTSPKVLGRKTNSNTFQIALVGDSYVYGTGVKEHERFQILLESMLSEIRPTKIYSFAMPGDSILDNMVKYKLIKENYDIHLYIFVLVENDLIFRPKSEYSSDLYTSILESCKSEDKNMVLTGDGLGGYAMRVKISLNNEPNLCVLRKIATEFPKNAIYFAADYGFHKSPGIDNYLNAFTNSNLNAITAQKGKELTDFDDPKYWQQGYEYFRVSKADGHPSKLAHKMYAQILFNEITKNPKW